MTWYTYQRDEWTPSDGPQTEGRAIHVSADADARPELRFLVDGSEFFHLSGERPRPTSDTTHTIAALDFSAVTGYRLFALHAQGNDLMFEDLRSPTHPEAFSDDEVERVESSLGEIMIPVYIDDVISDLSERLPCIIALHTAQQEGEAPESWTYFRTSLFDDGDLLLEDEYGAL